MDVVSNDVQEMINIEQELDSSTQPVDFKSVAFVDVDHDALLKARLIEVRQKRAFIDRVLNIPVV